MAYQLCNMHRHTGVYFQKHAHARSRATTFANATAAVTIAATARPANNTHMTITVARNCSCASAPSWPTLPCPWHHPAIRRAKHPGMRTRIGGGATIHVVMSLASTGLRT